MYFLDVTHHFFYLMRHVELDQYCLWWLNVVHLMEFNGGILPIECFHSQAEDQIKYCFRICTTWGVLVVVMVGLP